MNFLIIATSLAALLGATVVPAMAQTADTQTQTQVADRGDGHGRHGKHGSHHMMRMIDANGDGAISEDEAASLADHMFNRIDADNDGNLTETEFTTVHKGHRGWFNWSSAETDAVVKVRKEKFASLDTDKNASLSKAEFFVDAKAKLAAADTDKDGKVTPWEFRSQN